MSDISRGNRDQFDFWHSVSKLKSKEIGPIFIDWMWSVIQRYVQKVFIITKNDWEVHFFTNFSQCRYSFWRKLIGGMSLIKDLNY